MHGVVGLKEIVSYTRYYSTQINTKWSSDASLVGTNKTNVQYLSTNDKVPVEPSKELQESGLCQNHIKLLVRHGIRGVRIAEFSIVRPTRFEPTRTGSSRTYIACLSVKEVWRTTENQVQKRVVGNYSMLSK